MSSAICLNLDQSKILSSCTGLKPMCVISKSWHLAGKGLWLIEWMVFHAAFNSISVISRRQLTLFILSWVSPILGWALKCLAQGHSHEKTQGDVMRLEPRTPGLRVKHFTTEPRWTLEENCVCIVFEYSYWIRPNSRFIGMLFIALVNTMYIT